jgi:predicted AAA+ superfamily ATPase
MEKIIGRIEEQKLLLSLKDSPKAEFVALYGRRRVGKTFLINQLFGGDFAFKMTGVLDGSLKDQLAAFSDSMDDFGYDMEEKPKDWMEAFKLLKRALKPRVESGAPCVIFLDELPAMDANRSGIAKAVGYFWNSWASLFSNVTLIVCGSATSWMITNIVDSKGGLHDRITQEIHVRPFCLKETEEYFNENGFQWNRDIVLQAYMAFGGIPYYLSLLSPRESFAQNIDRLFFGPDEKMRREFKRLFATLYNRPEGYIEIVKKLCESKQGATRQELAESLKVSNNAFLGKKLDDLVHCDLLRKIPVREKKIKKNDFVFQLADFFCIFWLTFIQKAELENNYWQHHINTPEINTWMGLSFERICMSHIQQIKKALRIDGISTISYAWRSKSSTPGAQIDLVIERADKIVNLCEIKYSQTPYSIDKDEYQKLLNRREAFSKETRLRHSPWITMIVSEGLSQGMYSDIAQGVVTKDELFF